MVTPFVLRRYYSSIEFETCEISSDTDIAQMLYKIAVKHFQKYSFHTLYFNLRDKRESINQNLLIPLNRNALIHQLLVDGGGSCYHHNAVFQAILEDHGINSWFISCLVYDSLNPQNTFDIATHLAILFNYNDKLYLFDPGWNGATFSIYPLPMEPGEVVIHGKYLVEKNNNEEYPFSFAEIKNGKPVVRYDFNCTAKKLEDCRKAINYLNSEHYAFYTLFLFAKMTPLYHIFFINRRLVIQTHSGEEKFNAKVPENVSILEQITQLLGSQTGLMANLDAFCFKNEDLGNLICNPIKLPENLTDFFNIDVSYS